MPEPRTPELASPDAVRMVEYEYGFMLLLKRHLDKDSAAWRMCDDKTRVERGLLFRSYADVGKTDSDAISQVRKAGRQVTQAIESGQSLQDWLNPVDRASAHIVVRDGAGWFLMQLRSKDAKSSPGKWSIPGGGREPGETSEECALRELLEETGLGPDALLGEHLTPIGSYLDQKPDGLVRRYLFYADTTASNQDVICGEGDRMVFVAPHRIRELDLTEEAAAALSPYLPPEPPREPRHPRVSGAWEGIT